MPALALSTITSGPDLAPTDPANGQQLRVPRSQFWCLLGLPNQPIPVSAIVDTGAPLTIFPQEVWSRLRAGTDYELLPLPVGTPQARVAGWQFAFHLARFLAPVALMDAGLSVSVPRAGVIAQFAIGARTNWRSAPPVLIGLWGGLLEGAQVSIDRDPHTGRATGALNVP